VHNINYQGGVKGVHLDNFNYFDCCLMPFTPKEQSLLEKFGAKIVLLREQIRLSQQQLADMADIDIAILIETERGGSDVSLWDMHRLHKSLDIDSVGFLKDLQ
jgi:ribosome-binding protein aMBF1 (putative translation factor)